jgi:hypothetical protein
MHHIAEWRQLPGRTLTATPSAVTWSERPCGVTVGESRLASVDPADAATDAQIRARLERTGRPIGPLDTLIAAEAVAR